jgi:dephospho-CoA kinase
MKSEQNISSKDQNNSICIGITGGFGSGKTSAAKIISEAGYKVIYTDDLAKDLMNNDEKVREQLISAFGDETYKEGKLNNAHLASIVFSDNQDSVKSMEQLEKIVHPPVIERMMNLVDEYEAQGEKLIFVESALIYEANLDEGFDYILNVSANDDNVIERAGTRGITAKQLQNRLSKQIPPDQKAQWADFNIENNGTIDQLKSSVLMILEIMKAM